MLLNGRQPVLKTGVWETVGVRFLHLPLKFNLELKKSIVSMVGKILPTVPMNCVGSVKIFEFLNF